MAKLRGADGKYKPLAGLSNVQMQAIFELIHTNKTNKEIYEELGVPKSTWYDWFTQNLFCEELEKTRRSVYKTLGGEALKTVKKSLNCDNSKVALDAAITILKQLGDLNDKVDVNNNISTELKITFFDSNNDDENDEE